MRVPSCVAFQDDFNRFISGIPGALLIDDLAETGTTGGGRRADFLLSRGEVIGELKQLTAYAALTVERYWNGVAAKYDVDLRTREDLDRLLLHAEDPDRLRRGAIRAAASRLESDMKEANRQIRDTKEWFVLPDAIGLLVVVNERNETLHPEAVMWAASLILRRQKASCPQRWAPPGQTSL